MSSTKRFCECDGCGEINWHALEIKKVRAELDGDDIVIEFKCDKCGWHNIRRLKTSEE